MIPDNNYTSQFKKIIEKIVNAEMDKRGLVKYISAIVTSINENETVNVCIPPNLDSTITGLLNKTGENLNVGDSVELCAKNGTINNAWVAIKHKTNNSGVEILDYDSLINKPMVRIVNNNELSPTIIYNLDEGIYSLKGYVKFFVKDIDTTLFETPTIMIITSSGEEKYAQIFYPNGNKVVSYRINADDYIGTDRGLPSGGTTGQVLSKKTNSNYDVEWLDMPNDFYYKQGDKYIITDALLNVGGCITAAQKQIRFTLMLPKLLTKLSSITVNKAVLTVRHTGGGYLLDAVDVTSKVQAYIKGDNLIYLVYVSSSAMSATNNTPVAIEINDLQLTFN